MSGATILAKLGKLVFPCGPDKRPLVKWRECATTDLDQISDWRERWPNAMIGRDRPVMVLWHCPGAARYAAPAA